MKITKQQLKQIIKEEIKKTIKEAHIDTGIDPADIPSDKEAAQMKIDDEIRKLADPAEQQAVRDILAGERSDFWSLSDSAQYILSTIQRTILKEGENIDYFAVVAPDGKVFRVKRNSKRVVNDPQKAINLAATETSPRYRRGEFKVYEYAQYGGGVRKNPIFVGEAIEEAS